jgi:hypothetical protein
MQVGPSERDGGDRRERIDAIVKQELADLSELTAEEQELLLQTLLTRIQERAANETVISGDGAPVDVESEVVESTRSEVQRLMEADWNMDDLSLLLRVGIFLGAGAAAPVTGLAALPVAALLATYGAVLKLELGGAAMQKVAVLVANRAKEGVTDGVRQYTGKAQYSFGDLTEATVRRVTDNTDYRFGDLTKGALSGAAESVTGKEEYKFGDLTNAAGRAVTGDQDYKFGDLTKGLLKKLTGDEKKGKREGK